MSMSTLGPLRVRRFLKGAETNDKPALRVVLLHGFGAPGDDLAGLADAIDVPSGTTLVFPEALHNLAEISGQRMYGDARAWWMIDMERLHMAMAAGIERDLSQDVPEGLAEARAAVIAMLDALAKENPTARLVLGGFSQGAMLSLDVALRDPTRELAGVALLSGTMIAEAEWRACLKGGARSGLPVFQSHGKSDPLLPYSAAERLSKVLAEAGLNVTFDPFAGQHTIPLPTLNRLSAWIRALG